MILARPSGELAAASAYTLLLWRRLLSLNLMNPPLLASRFSSTASSPLSAFTELKRVRALPQIWLWLERMLCPL